MDYRDVISQEFVNSLFSDMKLKYEKVSSHEYLEWLKSIIERHGKEEEFFIIRIKKLLSPLSIYANTKSSLLMFSKFTFKELAVRS